MTEDRSKLLESAVDDLFKLFETPIKPARIEVLVVLANLIEREAYLTPDEVAERLGVNKQTVLRAVKPRHEFGPQTVRYLWSEITASSRQN